MTITDADTGHALVAIDDVWIFEVVSLDKTTFGYVRGPLGFPTWELAVRRFAEELSRASASEPPNTRELMAVESEVWSELVDRDGLAGGQLVASHPHPIYREIDGDRWAVRPRRRYLTVRDLLMRISAVAKSMDDAVSTYLEDDYWWVNDVHSPQDDGGVIHIEIDRSAPADTREF